MSTTSVRKLGHNKLQIKVTDLERRLESTSQELETLLKICEQQQSTVTQLTGQIESYGKRIRELEHVLQEKQSIIKQNEQKMYELQKSTNTLDLLLQQETQSHQQTKQEIAENCNKEENRQNCVRKQMRELEERYKVLNIMFDDKVKENNFLSDQLQQANLSHASAESDIQYYQQKLRRYQRIVADLPEQTSVGLQTEE